MPVFKLSKEIEFPYPELADEDGLLAIGGDLSIKRLLFAYENGIFPWYNPGEEILWWCTKPRFVLMPSKVNISKSMKKLMKKGSLHVTFNQDFSGVIHGCRKMREKEGTWISSELIEAYIRLYECGYAMSVETYLMDELVGGLYGVVIGKCFFGESMFAKVSNSSKLALITLAKRLEKEGFLFIDCQTYSVHLESMGATFMHWESFKKLLKVGCSMSESFTIPTMLT